MHLSQKYENTGASAVGNEVKTLPVTLASHIGATGLVLSAQLLTQLSANAPRKGAL